MICYDITLNGDRLFRAGVGEKGVLTATVTWVLRTAPGVAEPSDLSLSVGGLSEGSYLDWPVPRKLKIGDEVTIRIVDALESDAPSETKRDDEALVEAEQRRYYERLKAKYEPAGVRGAKRRRRTRG